MRRLVLRVLLLLVLPLSGLRAERVADLPQPTSYVNDFAHVLTPDGAAKIESLSREVHEKANAEIAVVTIKQLEDGQSVEEFGTALEEKWKLGKKGEDRSALIVMVLNPHKLRVETGYGLEGILNDARAGAILDKAVPYARDADYDDAMLTAAQGVAGVVATDAHVTLSPPAAPVHQYRRVPAQGSGRTGPGQIIVILGFLFVLFLLLRSGNAGWAFLLLQGLMGGGGGGGGGRGGDDDDGGGFSGSGGGGSGGGGASRDF